MTSFNMHELNHIQEELDQLREAAAAHEWYQCEVKVKHLLNQLKPQAAIEIALTQLQICLPVFERFHPTIVWPRQWYELALQFKSIDYEKHQFNFWNEDKIYDSSRGLLNWIAGAMLEALRYLNWAYSDFMGGKTQLCASHTGNAITILFSIPHAAYIAENCVPAYEAQSKVEDALAGIADPLRHFSRQELEEMENVTQAYRKCRSQYQDQYWTRVADEIKQRLEAQATDELKT